MKGELVEGDRRVVPNQISCPKTKTSLSLTFGPLTEMSQKAAMFKEESDHLQ